MRYTLSLVTAFTLLSLVACSIADDADQRGSSLQGATVDELRTKLGNPAPDYARLIRKDADGHDVVKVAVVTDFRGALDAENTRETNISSRSMRDLRSWLKSALPGAVEIVDEKDSSFESVVMDTPPKTETIRLADDHYEIRTTSGLALGGGSGPVAWDIDVFVGPGSAAAYEAIRDAGVVVLNGSTYFEMAAWQLGTRGDYKVMMINRCHSETIEAGILETAANLGIEITLVTSSVRVYYGELGAYSSRFLSHLITGGTWADMLDDLPGRVLRSATIKGASDEKREEAQRLAAECTARGGSASFTNELEVICNEATPAPTPVASPTGGP
jgi:hypothetical protein